MDLYHLIYTSSMVQHGSDVLSDILHTARRINSLRHITGMLLHANGSILQVLEGAYEDVTLTFRSIEKDLRHQDVFVLSTKEIAVRHFTAWSMGFKELNAIDLDRSVTAAQIFNSNRAEITNRVKPSEALALLVLFSQGIEMDS